jgi:hypothetical protein
MTVHQCPKCELRFEWVTELDQHCREEHPQFHHDYPVRGVHHNQFESPARDNAFESPPRDNAFESPPRDNAFESPPRDSEAEPPASSDRPRRL